MQLDVMILIHLYTVHAGWQWQPTLTQVVQHMIKRVAMVRKLFRHALLAQKSSVPQSQFLMRKQSAAVRVSAPACGPAALLAIVTGVTVVPVQHLICRQAGSSPPYGHAVTVRP